MKKIFILALLLATFSFLLACGEQQASNTARPLQNPGDTPTAAYKRLFSAVKSKNSEAVKQEVSSKTQALAQSLAARQNTPVEKVYENGFTATTFAESLPEIRDERVKDMMGAIEVWNSKDNKWEDLPYVREETGWKLAIGDVFAGTHKSPGKGRDAIEREAANVMSGNSNMKQMAPPANFNANSNSVNRPALKPANK